LAKDSVLESKKFKAFSATHHNMPWFGNCYCLCAMEAVVISVPLSLLGFRSGSSTSVATLSSKIEAFRECSGPDIP
jgi:hypothetical protein